MQFSEEKENFSGVIIDLTKIDNFCFTSVVVYDFFTFVAIGTLFFVSYISFWCSIYQAFGCGNWY